MSAAAREYFEDWTRYVERDPDYQNWLVVMATAAKEKVMNINNVFPSDYLKASDLGGRRLKLQISHVEMKTLGNDTKPVLYFKGKEKGLVLNKTKAQILASAYSPETDGWADQEVAIYPTKVSFQGQMVDAIGVEPVVPVLDPELNDDVPF